jgi:beta-glucosidase
MPRIRFVPVVSVCVLLAAPLTAQAPASIPYQDATLPVAARVDDLLARMTLDENVAQMLGVWNNKGAIQDAQGQFAPATAGDLLQNGLGQVSRPSEIAGTPTGPRTRTPLQEAQFTNAIQHWVMEHTRLKIPVMFHEEALHGLVAPKGTMFPVPLALASTWDPDLLERVMGAAAREARARGVQEVLSPVIDLGRDPRWGRVEETYGEDPYLVTQLGLGAVRGYQGRTLPLGPDKVFATLKHFTGHGSHEGGINTAPSLIPERVLRSEHLMSFEAAVKQAGAFFVMPSYNEIDGVPSHVNSWLLDRVLRQEWGFDGVIVSDYYAITQLISQHHVAADKADAAMQALAAGVDVELPDADAYKTLPDLVKAGQVSQAAIDRAVRRILEAKFLAGLFEHPYVDEAQAERVTNTPEHQALALEAAHKAIVLLENRNNTLPLARAAVRTLAVIGPNAAGLHLGGYSQDPGRGVDVLTGITTAAGPAIRVVTAEGVRITESEPIWARDSVELADPVKNRQRIQDAVRVARGADAVVLVIGTNESTSREAWADNHLGDMADITLMSQQDELAEAMFQLGKPVIVVLVNGRPVAMPKVAARASAILETWYAGQEGGTAVGEVLFGDVNPSGKLPISIPRDAGQIPDYYSRRPTSFRGYLDMPRDPQWTFGHGLSYTTFSVGTPVVTPAVTGPAGQVTVTVDVTNTGSRAGEEVVQLYLHDEVSSVTRPVRELRGFARVALAPGARQTVRFTLGPAELSLINRDMHRVVEPGRFTVMAGGDPAQLKTVTFEVR